MGKSRSQIICACVLFAVGSQQVAQAAQSNSPAPKSGAAAEKKNIPGALGNIKDRFVDTGPYMVEMSKKIKQFWHPPQNPKHVLIRWQIMPDGNIKGLKIERSSGDPASDKAAIEGVAASAPFAPLPKGLPTMSIEYGFGNEIRSGLHQVLMGDRVASQSLYNESVELVNKKQFPEALDKLEFALDRDPDNSQISQALRYIGAYVDDETPDNLHVLHRILALDPKQPAADQKLNVLHKAGGKDPTSVDVRAALCDEYLAAQNGEGALVEAQAAKKLKSDAVSQDKLTAAYRILAGQRMARKWHSVEKTRQDVECFCGLGRSYQLAGDYEKAQQYYNKALALDGGSDMAKQLVAKLEEERKTGTSSEVAKVAVAQHTSGGGSDLVSRAQVLNNEGIDLMKAKDLNAAIAKLKEALAVDPEYAFAKENLAVAYNNYAITLPAKESVVYLHRALFIWPKDGPARKNLNSALQSLGVKPESFDDRVKSASEYAQAGNFTSAVIEAKEALAIKADPKVAEQVKEYATKAPALP